MELEIVGLFGVSFLAATILPLSSEVVLTFLLLSGLNPALLVMVATIGNVLGSIVNYLLGVWGREYLIHRVLKVSASQLKRSVERFRRWGTWSLLLAWMPVIGDVLTLVAGGLRVNFFWFLFLVTLGKLGRYSVVTYLVLSVEAPFV